jgi:hypothetical protein
MFAKIRKPEREQVSAGKITIEFDQSKEVLNRKRLRELFLEEVQHFKKIKSDR